MTLAMVAPVPTQTHDVQNLAAQSPDTRAGVQLLIVLVLYNMAAESSPAFQALTGDPALSRRAQVLLWDNSPVASPVPAGFPGVARHDTGNPGLGVPYTAALQLAAARGVPWLVTLDQDTHITPAYVQELLRAIDQVPAAVSLILPRLQHRGSTVSPAWLQPAGPSRPYTGGAGAVVSDRPLQGFNSGAALRVSALQAVGGFNLDFPFDYLDHATFAALQATGGRVWVLQATLQHGLSSDTGAASTAEERLRLARTLEARRRFVQQYGSGHERLLYPVRVLREALSVLFKKRDLPGTLQLLRHLLRGFSR